MNLNMLLKLGNLICAHADFAKFIKKTLDVCNQQKEKNFYGILESILESYLKFDLGSLALISVMFINIAIII